MMSNTGTPPLPCMCLECVVFGGHQLPKQLPAYIKPIMPTSLTFKKRVANLLTKLSGRLF